MKSIMQLEKLLKIPYVDPERGIDVSPDGQQVVFSWNQSGQWEIYQTRLDLQPGMHIDDALQPKPPRQLTSGPGGKFAPRYSPDGSQLVYLLDVDGSESFDIWVCNLAQGMHTNLTPGTPDTIQPNLCWSPDGEQIAFLSDRSGHFDLYVMLAAVGSTPRLVYAPPGPAWDVRWSPDGRWLAVAAEGQGQNFATFIAPVQGGEIRAVAVDGAVIDAREVCWSPDGKYLAFASNFHGVYDIGIYQVDSGQVSWLTSGPADKNFPEWSPDGRRLVYICGEGPDTWLAVHAPVTLSSGEESAPATYQLEPGVCYTPHFTPDGRHLLFVFDSPHRPSDVWALALDRGAVGAEGAQQLTHSLPPEFNISDFVMPRHVVYPSLDGRSVPALLFCPPGSQGPFPAVVVIHGGPSWLYPYLWYPLFQHMVSRGWVVLAPNYRGSTGYGQEWQLANRFDLGGGDTRDVAAGADYLVREGLADPARIAVTGRSHGGYLTMSCLTQYPDRWAGGSAVVPFLNWFTAHANSRRDLQHWDRENMGSPQENRALWYERSPFFFLDRIQAPVQLICGANDPRCPASESIAARDALLDLGKTVDLILYPDEGHAFLKTENVIDHELRRISFLAQILEGSGT